MQQKSARVFGRDPVVITSAIEGVLASLLVFGFLDWTGINTAEEIAIVMAVVSAGFGVYVAWVTTEALLAGVLAFVKALAGLMAVYGYEVTQEQLGQLLGAITAISALWLRTQVGPAAKPSFSLTRTELADDPAALELPSISSTGFGESRMGPDLPPGA